jgi:general secretion pathway protein K
MRAIKAAIDNSRAGLNRLGLRLLGRHAADRCQCAADDRGFIIVAVLWILGLLAALVSIYAVYVTNAALSVSVNDDRLQAEALTSSAVELAAYQLVATDEKSRPTQGHFTLRMGRAGIAVEFRSEAARIDLNAAPKPLLAGLFAALGADYSQAEYYADRIIAWRSKAKDAGLDDEADAYRTAGLSYAPRQGPFASVGELWLVLDLPPVLVERALPFVTVYSGMPTVNIMDASPEVIAALPGMSADRLYAILSQRGTGAENAQVVLGLAGPARASATTDGSKASRVSVVVKFDNSRRVTAEAVILPKTNGDKPFHILYWRDDFDGPA